MTQAQIAADTAETDAIMALTDALALWRTIADAAKLADAGARLDAALRYAR